MQSMRTSMLAVIFMVFFCLLFLVGCLGDKKKKEGTDREDSTPQAMVSVQEQKDKEAIDELCTAISIDPNSSQAHYQLGLLSLKSGKVSQGLIELQLAASLDPNNHDAKIKLAEVYLRSQKKAAARKNIDEVLKQAPDNTDALALLANLEMLDNKHEAALVAIDKAITASPQDDRLYAVKGQILTTTHKFADAEKALLKALELDEKNAANHATLVAFYLELKEFGTAKNTLEKMAVAFPDSPQPYLQMASIELMKNNMAAAEEQLRQALKINPKDSQLQSMIANFYAKRGRFEQAEDLYKEALHNAEKKEAGAAQLADFYFDFGRFGLAREMMEKALAIDEKNAPATLVKARFLLKDGKNQEALDTVTTLIDEYPQWGELFFVKGLAHANLNELLLAKESLFKVIKFNPGFGKAHSLLAILFLQEGDFETTKREAAAALKINPRDFQAALALAKAVLFSEEYEHAEKMLIQLHAQAPEDVEVLGTLGLTYMGMKQHAKAKQALEKVLSLQPDTAKAFSLLLQMAQEEGASGEELVAMIHAQIAKAPKSGELHILLANLCLRINHSDKALEIYQKAQELAPENPHPYTMSALILNRQGKTDQALAEYKKLLAKQPQSIGAYMGLGSIYEQTGRDDLAKEAYTKILTTIKADFAPAANNLAWMITESKNPDLGEALRLAMTAKRQQPDNAGIIDTLGWVHYKRGAFTLARNEFTQAIQKQEDMPALYYHLALALYGEGKQQEAVEELEKVLEKNQPFEERDEAAATLQQWQSQQSSQQERGEER